MSTDSMTPVEGKADLATHNPTAFPVPEIRDADGCGIMAGEPGMSLRDYFAAQALTGLMQKDPYAEPDRHAWYAYRAADAMLAARAALPHP